MPRLLNKRAVITGGSNGIGRAIVEAYLQEGADVFFTVLSDVEKANSILEAFPESKVHYLKVDASRLEYVDLLVARAREFLGGIDILVNNAATITRTRFLDISATEYEKVMDVNTRFPFFVTQAVARYMVKHECQGSIVNISSISAFSAISKMAHYQCSKAALNMLAKSAAYELAPYGIRVNTILPGLTATKANRNQWEGNPSLWANRSSGIPLGRTGIPMDHAGAAVFLASDESSWITGAEIVIDGGRTTV